MMEAISQFHFLRPLWLLALLPVIALIGLSWRQRQAKGNWTSVISPDLLPWLLEGESSSHSRWPLLLLLSGWIISCLALAGPSWDKQPVPVSQNQNPLVVAIDLSYTMYSADLQPNRLTRARFKLQDLFNERKDGLSAIVAYAGSAHTVAPLTDDSRTLNNLARALSPDIMPVQGNNPADAIRSAIELLEQGSNEKGDILLMTGSVSQRQATEINELLTGKGIRLSILGVGTEQGAPIPLPDGGYLKDRQGTIVVPQLDIFQLQALATTNGGQYRTMNVNGSDLSALLNTIDNMPLSGNQTQTDREFDQWYDAGYWLVWLLLPLTLFSFRRGWLMILALSLLPLSQDSMAFEWEDLWQTRDQQGQQALQAGDAEAAAKLFDNPEWKAQALFESGQYDAAAKSLKGLDDANSIYNRGNALAKAGRLEEAIDAYKNALEKNPDFTDAAKNLETTSAELERKKQEEKQEEKQASQGEGNDQQEQSNQNNPQGQNHPSGHPNSSGNQKDPDKQNNSGYQQDPDGEHSSESKNSEISEPSNNMQQGIRPEQSNDIEDTNNQSISRKETEQDNTEENKQSGMPDSQGENPLQAEQPTTEAAEEQPTTPEQQAVESWLRTIPDDSSGLLRRKFMQQQRMREGGSW